MSAPLLKVTARHDAPSALGFQAKRCEWWRVLALRGLPNLTQRGLSELNGLMLALPMNQSADLLIGPLPTHVKLADREIGAPLAGWFRGSMRESFRGILIPALSLGERGNLFPRLAKF
jgi:hypothetical protein